MKKKIILLLTTLFMCFLVACGTEGNKDYESCKFDDLLPESFSWSMTMDEAEEFIKNNQENVTEIKRLDLTDYISFKGGNYAIRFDKNGKMDFIKILLEDKYIAMEELTEKYGPYVKEVDDSFYYWYGTLKGKKIRLVLEITETTKVYNYAFYLEEENK